MKYITRNIALFSLLAAVALTLRAGESATAPASGFALRPTAAESPAAVTGKITAKSATELTVDGKAVTINPATAYLKAGKAIAADDLNVGDAVTVVTATGDNGTLVAVTVTVLSAES